MGADECVLETELTNTGALGLYRSKGFVKEKRLHKYYLNGNDAFRLKYLFKLPEGFEQGHGCLGPPVEDHPIVSFGPDRNGTGSVRGRLSAMPEEEADEGTGADEKAAPPGG